MATSATSSLSNTRLFTAFVSSLARLTFIEGTKGDGTPYQLFETIDKNTGVVGTIGIGKSLRGMSKAELIAIKQDLYVSNGTDDMTGSTYTVLHLRGERLENDVTNDFA